MNTLQNVYDRLSDKTELAKHEVNLSLLDDIKKSEASDDIQKNYEIDIQELTDSYNAKADEIFRIKEKEILTV